ncbi:beta-propeller fold lactonase family protein [Gemmiger formicilis]
MKFPARTAARSRSFLPVFATELSYMLLAANQDSGCITCFRRDEKTGRLKPEKAGISCPVPVCIVAHPV